MNELKKNVQVFNQDIQTNQGYKYSTNSRFSSVVANKRITDAINELIPGNITSILDIGCGDGIYTNEIKKKKPYAEIYGMDPAIKAIEFAKEKYSNITFSVSNIYQKEDFKGRQFDLVVFRGVIHHLSDQELSIKNAYDFADSMIIVEPNGNNFILKLIERYSKYHIEHEEQSFTRKKLSEWCIKSGWEIKIIRHIGYVPMFFPTLPAKIILFFQPFLEKIPIIKKYLSAQIVFYCVKKKT